MEVQILQFKTYIDAIQKSVGSNLFQTVFANVEGKRKDITSGGRYSCATHVSSILLWFGLLKERHTGVDGLLIDMIDSGWYEIDKPKVGCVLRWENLSKNESENEHVGFFVGQEKAISNNAESRIPEKHHYTFGEEKGGPARKIEAIYWHPKLDAK